MKCGCPDIQSSIAFHYTRVHKPTLDDQKKLGCTIQNLRENRFLSLILSIDKIGIVELWIGASFAVHEDMKSQIGMCMSLGFGTIYAASFKQVLNTISTTESKLVGVVDAMPKMAWPQLFMVLHGYNVADIYVYQDNQIAILLNTNGMKSIGKGSRHIQIKYFFVTDRVKEKEKNHILFHQGDGGRLLHQTATTSTIRYSSEYSIRNI